MTTQRSVGDLFYDFMPWGSVKMKPYFTEVASSTLRSSSKCRGQSKKTKVTPPNWAGFWRPGAGKYLGCPDGELGHRDNTKTTGVDVVRRCLTTGWKVLIQRESWQALFVLAASATACFAELRVEPAQVVLYPNGTQQLVVSDDEVEQVDATSITAYNIQATEVANVSATGLVRATVAGETELHINHRGQHLSIPVRVLPSSQEPDVSFVTDVVPIFTKLGCNSGGCHGKATGQNGFKLSLLGFEPEFDYQALMHEARGRRLCLSAPAQSLLLRKAVSGVPHGGGRRLDVGSDDYRILEKWVGHGAQPPAIDDPRLERITLYPQRRSLRAQGRQQLLVTAHFSDGSHRDVTRQAVYESNQTDVAEVDADGVITAHADQGLTSHTSCRSY